MQETVLPVKNNQKPGLIYFSHSKLYQEFMLLRKIDSMGEVNIPLDTDDDELKRLFSDNNIQDLIDRRIIVNDIEKESLSLSGDGKGLLNKHYIDYQLDIIRIKKGIDEFFLERLEFLKSKNYSSIALYGAGDTALSFIGYIQDQGIEVKLIIDDDRTKASQILRGIPIRMPDEFDASVVDAIIVSSIEFQEVIFEKAEALAGDTIEIITIF